MEDMIVTQAGKELNFQSKELVPIILLVSKVLADLNLYTVRNVL